MKTGLSSLKLIHKISLFVGIPLIIISCVGMYFIVNARTQMAHVAEENEKLLVVEELITAETSKATNELLELSLKLSYIKSVYLKGILNGSGSVDLVSKEITTAKGIMKAFSATIQKLDPTGTEVLDQLFDDQLKTRLAFLKRQGVIIGQYLDLVNDEVIRVSELLKSGDLEGARNNFLFNESARYQAIDKNLDQTAEQIAIFSHDLVSNTIQHIDDLTVENLETATNQMLLAIALLSMIGLLVIAVSIEFVRRGISKPIAKAILLLKALSAGDMNIQAEGSARKDEIGDIYRSIIVFRDMAVEQARLELEVKNTALQSEDEKARAEAEKAIQDEVYREAVDVLGAGLERFSKGDFEQPIDNEFPDVLASLREYYNDTRGHLADTLSKVRATGNSLLGDADSLKEASSELAKRTETQAAALEETSAALKEITSNVKNSSERADEASTNITNARANSENSSKVVSSTIDAMSQIEKTSGEIASIISVIDDIAFQTNLLALNAGVEAARAGEAGKGFAVVAQEVRELAGRSAKAAKEIETLISNSGREVEAGVKLVNQAGEALAEIVNDVSNLDSHMQNIAQAAIEQSSGLNQISDAVYEMDQATQKNAEMVSHTNDVTQRVAGGSHLLHDLMESFKTRNICDNSRDVVERGSGVNQEIEDLKYEELPPQQIAV